MTQLGIHRVPDNYYCLIHQVYQQFVTATSRNTILRGITEEQHLDLSTQQPSTGMDQEWTE